jgi:hypothetical protein
MVRRARLRARVRCLPFDLSVEHVYGLLSRGRCSLTGVEWDFSPGPDTSRPWRPSLDRIDPRLGYVRGNVQVICWAVNRAKSDMRPADFERLRRVLSTPEIT